MQIDYMSEEERVPEDRKAERRKRRIRNQIISYIVVLVFVVALGVGGVTAVKQLLTKEKQIELEKAESSQAIVEEILSSEEVIETPEPIPEEPEITEPTPEETMKEIVEAAISVMPLEDKVAGLFIVTPEAITGVSTAVKAGPGTQSALNQYAVGGLIYFDKNIQSQSQLKEMVDNTQLYSKYPLFLAIDEEGGKVARLSGKGIGTKVEKAAVIGQDSDTDKAYESGVILGSNLREIGLNLDLAPVTDVNVAEGNYLGERTYGSDAQTVGAMAAAVMQGIQSNGVATCLKHFPGIGSVKKDPHKGVASTDRTEEQFRAEEFVAFQAGIDAGADMVMISNITAQELTGNMDPCVFSSKVVTDILRGEMGFEGIIITDAMNMGAISEYFDSEEATVLALKAGCDMILMPENFEKAYNGVLQAVQNGTISEERINDALRRIYRVKYAGKIEK